ncbi:hydantoinase B/oxoprolinase family protein [Amycolatopsis jiangsuensis]|uniref:N-methylhydantoinase B n=1 Tax=Amycolatopsis jiangsuensis TaxID=1181879 RepID=A0A840IQ62_9PSEU|nr:hydantoinase B/oxoprolinase family protein [Amycolatopsis jiangsuensis]MBB4684050.1 N-methylhydantoinase B [Amycolatopsis jiangsuensis]
MSGPILRDAATFEVFRNAVDGLADELAITILRTAHSQIVASSMDFSAALCDRDGRTIAQANTCPVHLGSIPDAMRAVLDAFGDEITEGDLYVLNDPSLGGMHLPDLFVVAPVFFEDDLLGYVVTVVNHSDVGGWSPGSMASQSTSIFAEGIQIPPSRLRHAGVLNETFFQLVLRNVREPDLMRGDLESQLAACHAGAAGLRNLAARYGLAEYRALVDELLDYSEALVRDALGHAPDGVYSFEDQIDDDGLGSGPIPFRVRITIEGSDITFDFTGSSPQVASALNATSSFTRSAAYTALQGAMGADIPANSGFYRPFRFVIPEASILNGRRPAARGARGLVAYRIIDLVLGALAPALPEHVPAAGDGGPGSVALGVTEPDGRQVVVWDFFMGSWGATRSGDGNDGISPLGANMANIPVEEVESSGHVRIDRYGYVPDSGGAGRHRGGLSLVRDLTVLCTGATMQIRSDRSVSQPYGLHGGRAGAPSRNLLDHGTDRERLLATKPFLAVGQGATLRHVTAGGGGYGEPFERAESAVLEDVLEGKVSIEAAAGDYGVVIDPGTRAVDSAATARLRQRHSERRQS